MAAACPGDESMKEHLAFRLLRPSHIVYSANEIILFSRGSATKISWCRPCIPMKSSTTFAYESNTGLLHALHICILRMSLTKKSKGPRKTLDSGLTTRGAR